MTRSTYDIRGNLLTVTDPLGRVAFEYTYDLANRPLRTLSMDAGLRRVMVDAAGHELERRDSTGALLLRAFDPLSRPERLWARDDANAMMTLRERLEYGDYGSSSQPSQDREDNRDLNRLGRLATHYDEAGRLLFSEYDFKGNLTDKTRQVISDDQILEVFNDAAANNWEIGAFRVNWEPPPGTSLDDHAAAMLDSFEYRTESAFDALNRVVTLCYPEDADGPEQRKVLRPTYNRAGALESVTLNDAMYVERIAYNARGQRILIAYGNGVMTRYAYHPKTFRLARMRSETYTQPQGSSYTYQLSASSSPLQDLSYTYDLSGNPLAIQDRTRGCGVTNNLDAAKYSGTELATLLSSGDALIREFEYDPLYRLTRATGRECGDIGSPRPWTDDARCGYGSGNHGTATQDNAPNLTRTYVESYTYDPANNLVRMKHQAGGSTWNRYMGVGGHSYQQWSAAWPDHLNAGEWTSPPENRLTHVGDNSENGSQTHTFDDNGNLLVENVTRHFEWDHSDRLRVYRTQSSGSEPSVYAQYLYDSSGQRVKKVVRKQGGSPIDTTVYIDGVFEHHIKDQGGSVTENNT